MSMTQSMNAPEGLRSNDSDEPEFDESGAWRDPAWRHAGQDFAPEAIARSLPELIDALPPSQSRAFLMREVQGLAPGDICARMDIAPGDLEVLLHRARIALCARIAGGRLPRD